MNWNQGIRWAHRWVSIAFTLAVIANGIAVKLNKYNNWFGVAALLPLAVLLFTGLYLFVLPYIAKRRAARRISG